MHLSIISPIPMRTKKDRKRPQQTPRANRRPTIRYAHMLTKATSDRPFWPINLIKRITPMQICDFQHLMGIASQGLPRLQRHCNSPVGGELSKLELGLTCQCHFITVQYLLATAVVPSVFIFQQLSHHFRQGGPLRPLLSPPL